MVAEVVNLERKVNKDLVAELRILLEQAEDGALVGLLYATIDNDLTIDSGWAVPPDAPMRASVGALEVLKYRVLSSHCDVL